MKLIRVQNYEQMSKEAAEIINEQIINKPKSVLGLATGSTPIGTYKLLIKSNEQNQTDWSLIKTFNLDEYIGIDQEHKMSYKYFMKENLFSKVNIDLKNTYIPYNKGNIKENAEEYEKLIAKSGYIDLQILGIGTNGHIGFNEPGSKINSITREIDLKNETISSNARFFDSIDKVPKKAITMGIETILKSKKIVLLASGKNKAQAIKDTLEMEPNSQVPSSFLQKHNNVIVIADEEACSLLSIDSCCS